VLDSLRADDRFLEVDDRIGESSGIVVLRLDPSLDLEGGAEEVRRLGPPEAVNVVSPPMIWVEPRSTKSSIPSKSSAVPGAAEIAPPVTQSVATSWLVSVPSLPAGELSTAITLPVPSSSLQ